MDLKNFNENIEDWFLTKKPEDFPGAINFVTKYGELVQALKPIHKQVTAGADFSDGKVSYTWHDESHIKKVIKQASKLLSYKDVTVTCYEVFALLVAIQIHDIKNIEGRDEHENRAIQIFNDLNIAGLIDSILLKNIGFIASCHAGSFAIDGRKEKDKISLLASSVFNGDRKIRLRFLAAILRLADEYSDDSERAMAFLLQIGRIKKGSIIHQKHAQSLIDVDIESNTGKVDFDYHVAVEDALIKFPIYIKGKDTYEDKYLLDEIFDRTLKSHYETVYCMRFLRPDISISKIHVCIEIENLSIENQLKLSYELEEKGYPNTDSSFLDLCGDKYLKHNGGYWTGENLKNYLESEIKK